MIATLVPEGLRCLTDDQLVAELHALGMHFLSGGDVAHISPPVSPVELLAGLACSKNARIRSAIIPLLLIHPILTDAAAETAQLLQDPAKCTLMLFYTASCLLQEKYWQQLKTLTGMNEKLPDLFGRQLGVVLTNDSSLDLDNLGKLHRRLSGFNINWGGTYEHAAIRIIQRLESERVWQIQKL